MEEKQEKWRYEQGLNRFLGNNTTPKDQWVEEKARKEAKAKEESLKVEEDRASLYPDYYDSVKIFE